MAIATTVARSEGLSRHPSNEKRSAHQVNANRKMGLPTQLHKSCEEGEKRSCGPSFGGSTKVTFPGSRPFREFGHRKYTPSTHSNKLWDTVGGPCDSVMQKKDRP